MDMGYTRPTRVPDRHKMPNDHQIVMSRDESVAPRRRRVNSRTGPVIAPSRVSDIAKTRGDIGSCHAWGPPGASMDVCAVAGPQRDHDVAGLPQQARPTGRQTAANVEVGSVLDMRSRTLCRGLRRRCAAACRHLWVRPQLSSTASTTTSSSNQDCPDAHSARFDPGAPGVPVRRRSARAGSPRSGRQREEGVGSGVCAGDAVLCRRSPEAARGSAGYKGARSAQATAALCGFPSDAHARARRWRIAEAQSTPPSRARPLAHRPGITSTSSSARRRHRAQVERVELSDAQGVRDAYRPGRRMCLRSAHGQARPVPGWKATMATSTVSRAVLIPHRFPRDLLEVDVGLLPARLGTPEVITVADNRWAAQ